MTLDDTVRLLAFISARLGQAFRVEDGMSAAWHVDLQHYPAADAIEAARIVTARQTFCSLADLLTQVRAIRTARLSAIDTPAPPVELLDDTTSYAAFLREQARRVADGQPPLPGAPELPGRSRREQLAIHGRRLFHGPHSRRSNT